MSSLRERRRKQTEQTIRLAAIELAYELGLDNVTTEMISESAGISPRTFFNYFPYKEAAFLPPKLGFSDEMIESFINGKGALLEDVVALFMAHNIDADIDRGSFIKGHEIALKNPKLIALRITTFEGLNLEVSALMAKRLGTESTNPDVMHKAALIMTSVRIGLEAWVSNDSCPLSESVKLHVLALKNIFNEN